VIRVSGWLMVVLAVVTGVLVVTAPVDSMQGVIQKILYVHVPCAFSAYAGFILTGICGGLYLWKNDERYDRLALAGAEVGVIFCSLTVATGPIWARGTWGHWWGCSGSSTCPTCCCAASRRAASGPPASRRSTG
jgi:heme exporter protein C